MTAGPRRLGQGALLPGVVVVLLGSFVAAQRDFGRSWGWVVVTGAGLVGLLVSSWVIDQHPPAQAAPVATTPTAVVRDAAPRLDPLLVVAAPAPAPPRPVPPAPPPDVPPQRASRPQGGVLVVSCAKLGAADAENEDAAAVDAGRARYVVSDGASSSFAAREWSRALVDAVIGAPNPLASAAALDDTVALAAAAWSRELERGGADGWWAQAGLDRGAFATLLVVELRTGPGGLQWAAAAVGDSCLIQARCTAGVWTIVDSFPLASPDAFDSNPALCSTASPSIAGDVVARRAALRPGDALLLATDAVSQWLLGDPARVGAAMAADGRQLVGLFTEARTTGEMVDDDTTLVRITAADLLR